MKTRAVLCISAVVLFGSASTTQAVGIPDTPQTEPDGVAKNRFISFVLPTGGAGAETAIEVRLLTLNRRCQQGLLNQFEPCSEDADCPGGVCDKPFASKEGSVRYVNIYKVCGGTHSVPRCFTNEDCVGVGDETCVASLFCPDDVFQPDFPCAVLGCEPEFRNWAGELAGATLHVFGEGIVPGRSAYDVAQVPFACEGDVANCAFTSPSLRIITARWADFNDDGSTNAIDIALAVNKLKTIRPPGALTKPRMKLVPSLLLAYIGVSAILLQNTIDAVSSLPQTGLIAGPQSCPND